MSRPESSILQYFSGLFDSDGDGCWLFFFLFGFLANFCDYYYYCIVALTRSHSPDICDDLLQLLFEKLVVLQFAFFFWDKSLDGLDINIPIIPLKPEQYL